MHYGPEQLMALSSLNFLLTHGGGKNIFPVEIKWTLCPPLYVFCHRHRQGRSNLNTLSTTFYKKTTQSMQGYFSQKPGIYTNGKKLAKV